jgi:hypothetical protein
LGSPVTGPAIGSTTFCNFKPLASAAGRIDAMAASMTAGRSIRCTSSRICPEMIRLMSSRSSMSWACTRALRAITESPSTMSA